MSLAEFTAKIKNENVARTNYFYFKCKTPPTMGAGMLERDLELLCSTVTAPGMSLLTNDVNYNTVTYANVNGAEYENFEATFYVDGNMNIKAIFDAWMNMIFEPRTGVVGWRKEYITDLSIVQVDINSNNIYKVDIKNAFPISISPIQYSSASSDIVQISVTFSYDYWLNERIGYSSPAAARELSWIEKIQKGIGSILGIYQGAKNIYGNVTGTAKQIGSYGKSAQKSKSVDGTLRSGSGALGSLGRLF